MKLLQTRTVVAKAPPTNGEKVARAWTSVFGLQYIINIVGGGKGVTAGAEVEGDSSSHVGTCSLDGRRGHIVREAVASFVGKSEPVTLNILERR